MEGLEVVLYNFYLVLGNPQEMTSHTVYNQLKVYCRCLGPHPGLQRPSCGSKCPDPQFFKAENTSRYFAWWLYKGFPEALSFHRS